MPSSHPVCDVLYGYVVVSPNQCCVHFTLRFIESLQLCVSACFHSIYCFRHNFPHSPCRGVICLLLSLLHAWFFCWLRVRHTLYRICALFYCARSTLYYCSLNHSMQPASQFSLAPSALAFNHPSPSPSLWLSLWFYPHQRLIRFCV